MTVFNFRSPAADRFRRKSKKTTACSTMWRTSDGSRISSQTNGRVVDWLSQVSVSVSAWCLQVMQLWLCVYQCGFAARSVGMRAFGVRSVCFGCVCWGGGFHALYISLGTSDTPRPPKQMLLLLSTEMRSYRHYDHNHCTLTYYKIILITIWWDSRFFWSLLESSTVSAMAPEMRHADSERDSGNEKRHKR